MTQSEDVPEECPEEIDTEERLTADQLPNKGLNRSGSPVDHGPLHRFP
jgi:hypothetical protein